MNSLVEKFKELKKWKKIMIVIALIILIVFWIVVLGDFSENWGEWGEHINNNH